jgi:hypothetical protein
VENISELSQNINFEVTPAQLTITYMYSCLTIIGKVLGLCKSLASEV